MATDIGYAFSMIRRLNQLRGGLQNFDVKGFSRV